MSFKTRLGVSTIQHPYDSQYIIHLIHRTNNTLIFAYHTDQHYSAEAETGIRTFEGIATPHDPPREIILPLPS